MDRSRLLLTASIVCLWAGLYFYVPTLAPYAEHVGAPLGMVGLIVSAYGFSQLVLRIPVGLWSDRIGRRKPFIVLAFLASSGAALGFILARGPVGLLAARAASGIAATMWVVITVLYAGYYPPDQAGRAMSRINFMTILTQLGATLTGGLIAEKWGWHAPFWAALVVAGVGLLLTLPLRDAPHKTIGVDPRQLWAVGKERGLLIVSFLGILTQFNTWVTIFGFVPNYAVDLGASKAQLGWLSLIAAVPNALAALATGSRTARRLSEGRFIVAGFLILVASTAAIPFTRSLGSLYVSQAVGGLGRGLVFPVLMGLSIKTVPEEKRATAMGFFQSIYALGMFAGPAASGWFAAKVGLSVTFHVTAGLTLLGAWIAHRALFRDPTDYVKVKGASG